MKTKSFHMMVIELFAWDDLVGQFLRWPMPDPFARADI